MSYGFNSDKSKFPLGAASDLPDPTKTPLKIIGELQNQIIDSASIENGATASKAYASGDYVCFQGALCKASKAISQGDTLSIGDSANDNLTLTDAAAEFARINSDLSDSFPELYSYDNAGVYNSTCAFNVLPKQFDRYALVFPRYSLHNGFLYKYGLGTVAANATQGTFAVRNNDGTPVNDHAVDVYVLLFKKSS